MKKNICIFRLLPLTALIVFFLFGCNNDPPGNVQSGPPVFSEDVVIKTDYIQPVIELTLSSEHGADSVWKAYDAASGGRALETIVFDYHQPHTLLMISTTGDIEAGDYWITVTERGRSESPRVRITILSIELPPTRTPVTDTPGVNKILAQQNEVRFSLTGEQFASGSVWRAWQTQTCNNLIQGVTVSYYRALNEIAIRTTAADLPVRIYWVGVTESGFSESERLALWVLPYTPPGTSSMPFSNMDVVTKTASPQREVSIILNSIHPADTIFFAYDRPTSGNVLIDVSLAFNPAARELTLTAARSDLPAGVYYITATEPGLLESERFALTILPFTTPNQTPAPVAEFIGANITKSAAVQASVDFTLLSDHPADSVWRVYNVPVAGTPLTNVNVNFNTATRILTLSAAGDLPAGNYFVSVQETGKSESERLALVVRPFFHERSTTPSVAAFAHRVAVKTAPVQRSATFTLSSSHPANAVWRVHDSAVGGQEITTITASFSAPNLTLTAAGSDLAARTYYISVTESGLRESHRLALTVGGYAGLHVPILRYAVHPTANVFTATPSSGVPWDAVLNTGAGIRTIGSHRFVEIGDVDGWVDLGAGAGAALIANRNSFTIETYLMLFDNSDMGGAGRFIWTFSDTSAASASAGRYIWMRAPNSVFAVSRGGFGSGNQVASGSAPGIPRGWWSHVVVTKNNDLFTVFVNGEIVGTATSAFFNEIVSLNYNWLSRPVFPTDNFLRRVRYYRLNIYDRALTQDQIRNELGATANLMLLPIQAPVPVETPVILPMNATVAKSSIVQREVSFRLESGSFGFCRVYMAPTGGAPLDDIRGVVAGAEGRLFLTLYSTGDDIQTGTFYVSVVSHCPDANESDRIPLTILPFVPPEKQVTIRFGGIPEEPVSISGSGQIVSKNGGSLNVSITDAGRFDRFVWRLNGIVQPAQTGGTFNLNNVAITSLPNGEHRLMVIAFTDNIPWSGEIAFTVTD